jgi:ribosomal protein S30
MWGAEEPPSFAAGMRCGKIWENAPKIVSNMRKQITPRAPQVTFRNTIRYKHDKELMVAAEGMYTGQVRRRGAATRHAGR